MFLLCDKVFLWFLVVVIFIMLRFDTVILRSFESLVKSVFFSRLSVAGESGKETTQDIPMGFTFTFPTTENANFFPNLNDNSKRK